MKKLFKKILKKSSENEKGIAILFTLGILALLLVMALSFATDSIIERKVAFNTNSRSQASLLAKSALNRAMASMQFYSSLSSIDYGSTTFSEYDIPFLKSYSYDAATDADWLCKLNTPGIYKYVPAVTSPQPCWQLVREDPTNLTSKIIGRFAYVVLERPGEYVSTTDDPNAQWGRIDIAAAVDSGTATNSYMESYSSRTRPGVNVSELYLCAIDLSKIWLADGSLDKLSASSSTNGVTTEVGLLPDGKRWGSFDILFSKLGLLGSANQATRNKFLTYFKVDNPPDIEAYNVWDDTTAPAGSLNNGELKPYHRFNLARTDWSWDATKLPEYSKLGLPQNANIDDANQNAVNMLLCEGTYLPTPFSSSATTPTLSGIEYLRRIGVDRDTFPDPNGLSNRRKQIAANILDYCDGDVVCTADKSDWSVATLATTSNRPSYTGLENTFYINKLGCYGRLNTITRTEDPPPPAAAINKQYNTVFRCYLGAELVNMYGASVVAGNYSLTVGATITVTITDEDGNPYLGTYNSPVTITPIATSSSNDCIMMWSAPIDIPVNTNLMGKDKTIRASAVVNFDFAMLMSPSGNADFCNINGISSTSHEFYPAINAADGAVSDCWGSFISLKYGDPRQNLNATDWEFKAGETMSLGYNIASAIPAINHQWVYKADKQYYMDASATTPLLNPLRPADTNNKDMEGLTGFPSGISTAYIRNALMASPWELGTIHRGAAWETINLKGYNTATTMRHPSTLTSLGDAGGAYYNSANTEWGDAGIMDQIKMTDDVLTYGKVDLNMKNAVAMKTLFYKIPYNCSYSDPGNVSGNVIYVDADLDTITAAITGKTTTFLNRAEIARAIGGKYLADGFGASLSPAINATDAAQEEIIGKTINLTKAGMPESEFTIIAYAQTILDVGPSTGSITIKKDLDNDGNIGNASEATLGQDIDGDGATTSTINETISGVSRGSYQQYADEITGEQKILATVIRKWDTTTNTFRFELKKIEYLQD